MSFRTNAPRCPVCNALLEHEMLFEMRVERCASCGGVWLDNLALEPEAQAQSERRAEGTSLTQLDPPSNCPRCETALTRAPLGDVHARTCLACGGAFIARDDFDAILAAPARAGTMPPPRDNHVRVLAVLRALARRPLSRELRNEA